jgi:non-specific serine/threonine protein kinase
MRQCPLCARQYDDAVAFCPQDGRVLLLPDPMLGRVLDGKYRVDALLGGGGQSTVYRATHVHLQRRAAVKLIRGDFDEANNVIERFKREALAVARLNHPHIVTVHDFGFDPETGAYLVMEYLEGRSLRREMSRDGRLALEDAVAVIRQVCGGVAAAHGAGIVHRDLKPDNIFLEARPGGARFAKILDFGVAKLRALPDSGDKFDSDPYISSSTVGVGTPAYMSPEQCEGRGLDARSDIYSLGCMLFELLTGRVPFVADGLAPLYRKHIEEPPLTPSSVVPGLPPALDRIVLRALAKRPEDRFQTADELCDALDAASLATPQHGAQPVADARAGGRRASDRTVRNNLPQLVTVFVGREREIGAVGDALAISRLVTITGPGGSGKTRLSLEVARGLFEAFPDGVWQVQLAALADAALVPQAVAMALGIRESGRPPAAALLDFLQFKRTLLLLDNCEHLVGACAELADAILRTCPFVRVLATSQEPLTILGEATHALAPLSLPEGNGGEASGDIMRFEAVRLFVDRARLANSAFALTAENAPAVARVCQRLDGIPLAIELAAARVKVLPVDQIDARLDDRFRLLTGGSRTAEPRQRTLQATIDWSYDLLVGPARTVFDRLSVFAGGFALEAAEAVCSGDGVASDDVLYLLSNLIDKSLVLVDERQGAARYRLLQTIRQYAGEKLRLSGKAPDARTRHRDFYLAFAERAERELKGPDQEVWLGRLELEHDNLRAALEWSKTDAAASSAYTRLAGALAQFWLVRGHAREGLAWLEDALALGRGAPPRERAKALHGAGLLARICGDYGRAGALHAESLEVWRELGDEANAAPALNQLAIVTLWRGDYDEASRLLDEALARARCVAAERETSVALKNLGIIAHYRSRYEEARALLEESLAVSRRLDDTREIAATLNNRAVVAASEGDFAASTELMTEVLALNRRLGERRGVAMSLNNLGALAQYRGDYEAAEELLTESLLINLDLGDRRLIAYVLECFTSLTAERGQFERALRLAGAAEALRETIGSPLAPAEREDLDRSVAKARAALADEVAEGAFGAGRALTLEQAVNLVLDPPAA